MIPHYTFGSIFLFIYTGLNLIRCKFKKIFRTNKEFRRFFRIFP